MKEQPAASITARVLFCLLEEREYDAVHSSLDAALVASLFLIWHGTSSDGSSSYSACAIVLYKRRSNLFSSSTAVIPHTLSQ